MEMQGLLLRHDGYSDAGGFHGNQLENPEEYLQLSTIPRPIPGPGQVLIKVRRAGVNPSDVAFVKGLYGQPRRKGIPAGFEGVGTVVDAGPGLMGRLLKGRSVGFYVSPDGSGAWAEYAVTDATMVLPLKKGVLDKDGAALLVNPVTAAAMLEMVPRGEAFVFSAGASQLGKLMAGLAKDQGKRMISLVRRDTPISALKALGATHVLNETAESYVADFARILEQEKPKVFWDAVAGMSSARVFKAMGEGTRWIVYGQLDSSPMEVLDPIEMITSRKQIEGFWTTQWINDTSFFHKLKVSSDVQNRFRDGRWSTDISSELPIEHALQTMSESMAQPDGKVQIIMPDR